MESLNPLMMLLLLLLASLQAVRSMVDITHDSLQSFFDDKVETLRNETHGVGMTVCVVNRGEVVFQKGYGHANLVLGTPVDPGTTLFRVGSISKLFVWTAVMQLVELNKLDLDTDVNTYLVSKNIQIPNTFPGHPITMHHLMSHTCGFDDYLFGLFLNDPSKIMTLEQVIRNYMPKRKRKPGIEIEYSNYGAMLAGYLVEVVSGISFEEFTERNIFQPLHMTYATFRQPLPDHLQKHMSIGYGYNGNNDEVQPRDFEIVQGTPAGGASISAVDMAKFLRAHMMDSTDDNSDKNPLFRDPRTMLKKMHSTSFQGHPDIFNGIAHGFLEIGVHGQRALGHGGSTVYFHSNAAIVPQHKLGVFFSLNTGSENGSKPMAVAKLYVDFMRHFFQDDAVPTGRELAKQFDSCTDAKQYAGDYLANRRCEEEPFKLMALMFNMKVGLDKADNDDNEGVSTIRVFNMFTMQMEPYVEVSPGVFQAADGDDRIVFLRNDETGEVRGLLYSLLPFFTFHRPPIWESPLLNAIIAQVGIVMLLLGAFVPPTGMLTRFAYRVNDEKSPQSVVVGTKIAGWLGFCVALIYLGFFASLYTALGSDFIFAGRPPMWPFRIPWAGFAAGVTLPFCTIMAWRHRYWGFKGRVFYTTFSLAMQAFFWFLWYWKIAASPMALLGAI